MSEQGDILFICFILIFIFCLYAWNICTARQQREQIERIRIQDEMRQDRSSVILQNCGYTCDPLSDRPNRTAFNGDSSPPYYGSGEFPNTFAISGTNPRLEIPPPTYEEAIRNSLTQSDLDRLAPPRGVAAVHM